MSPLPADLLQAYRATDYVVTGEPPCVLRIGVASACLQTLYARHGADCATFLSACNPGSRLLAAEENAARQLALAAALREQGRVFLPGVGRHPQGGWPAEESFLVFGLTETEARSIGSAWQQNAIVWCGADAVPQLLLLV